MKMEDIAKKYPKNIKIAKDAYYEQEIGKLKARLDNIEKIVLYMLKYEEESDKKEEKK